VKKIKTPLTKSELKKLKAGDRVLISGVIYTARDQAHKRIVDNIDKEEVPFPLSGALIYYAGPTPAKPDEIIGSIGPTTSYRMDAFTPALLKAGVLGMIGKGQRSDDVISAIRKHRAVYFLAGGGFGALLSQRVKKAKVIAYKELGAEAVRELEVENFPVIVGIDSFGKSIL